MLKSWSKKKKSEMVGQYKVTKPDIDNLIKTQRVISCFRVQFQYLISSFCSKSHL
ncbi:RusA family crossover junction endodeoxyribonuclease [Staphylococcus aureus]|uniref:RusA family crossover junction endodeoxyribonuclease n=1 Tax=Staphylococcus aureus TaxID=1280 RepID=UPI0035C7A023